MLNLLQSSTLCILFIVVGFAQTAEVTLQVRSESQLEPDEKIYVSGNQPELGNWSPAVSPLLKVGEYWTRTFSFKTGTALEFKFTKGSWDAEAVTSEGWVPANYQLQVARDTVLEFIIPFWKDSLYNSTPEISGEYNIHEDFPVAGLDSRRVIVWLPPGYQDGTTRRYPVLYVHDGQNVFDPNTSAWKHDWRIDEIADSLMAAGEIEEFICVAVYGDPDLRGKEYSDDSDSGEKYQDFMCCQLKPWIDSMYRTSPGPESTAVMGSSMGGLISFILAWEYPDVFGKAACLSPAFKFQQYGFNVDYVTTVAEDDRKRSIELYIDNGTLDVERILQPGIDGMLEVLDGKGYRYHWFLDDGAAHNEIAWSKRVWRPLKQFFPPE